MRLFSPLFLALAAAVVTGCAVGPNYHTPEEHPPAEFAAVHGQLSMAAKPSSSSPQAPAVDFATWWRALNDPELDSLVNRAVAANPDILIALDRLQAARTYERGLIGIALPDLNASAAAGRGTGTDLTRSRAAQPLISADTSAGLQHINEIGGFDSIWELDVFGGYRREIQAARADAQADLAQRNSVLISVIADVARAYVDMRGLQTRAAILHHAADTLQESLRIVRIRYERGITNELDVTLAARELGVLQAQIAPVEAAISAAQYTIATLLGLYPEDLIQELRAPAMIPSVPAVVQSGLPLDLLRRRPDIAQAERELAGATARIGVATADLFPRLAVVGAIGYQKQGLGTTPALGQHIWSAGPAAAWSLLDFGALDAQVEVARLRTRAQLVNYKRTIQNAVKEVDTTWGDYAAQQDRLARLGEALVASQRAVTLANERYTRGLTDFLNVVDAERQEYDIEEQYSDAQVAAAEQFIALYRALGGGWESYQALPPVHVPQPAIIAAFHRLFVRGDDVLQDQGPAMPAAVAPADPGAAESTSAVGVSGSLVVYSARYPQTVEQSEYPAHTNYTVATTRDAVIRRVANNTGSFGASPATIALPCGKYHVRAQYGRGRFVIVPITIEAGKRTVVDLTQEDFATGIGPRAPIRLPSGEVVGWRSTGG